MSFLLTRPRASLRNRASLLSGPSYFESGLFELSLAALLSWEAKIFSCGFCPPPPLNVLMTLLLYILKPGAPPNPTFVNPPVAPPMFDRFIAETELIGYINYSTCFWSIPRSFCNLCNSLLSLFCCYRSTILFSYSAYLPYRLLISWSFNMDYLCSYSILIFICFEFSIMSSALYTALLLLSELMIFWS